MPSNHSSRQRRTPQLGQLRIIGGKYRGRKLTVREQQGLRPTGNRTRETAFNWLQPSLSGATCADLFSGTGAMGFEACSRNAQKVHFIDVEKLNIQLINESKKTLSDTCSVTHQCDALVWLDNNEETLDIIFIDPPFDSDLLAKTLALLATYTHIHSDTLIYIEARKGDAIRLPKVFTWLKHKYSGDVQFGIIQKC